MGQLKREYESKTKKNFPLILVVDFKLELVIIYHLENVIDVTLLTKEISVYLGISKNFRIKTKMLKIIFIKEFIIFFQISQIEGN